MKQLSKKMRKIGLESLDKVKESIIEIYKKGEKYNKVRIPILTEDMTFDEIQYDVCNLKFHIIFPVLKKNSKSAIKFPWNTKGTVSCDFKDIEHRKIFLQNWDYREAL